MSPFARIFGSAAVAGCIGGTCPAATSVCHDGYTIETWQTEDGLPQNTVTAITQTRDGYLWVGTLNGLARFDGVRFQIFDGFNTSGLRDGRITALYEDRAGTLWIGHDSGHLTRYADGAFATVCAPSQPFDDVRAVAEDAQGLQWILRGSGQLQSAAGATLDAAAHTPTEPSLLGFARNTAGEIWAVVDGVVLEVREGCLERLVFDTAQYSDYVYGIGEALRTGVWVARDQRLRVWENGGWNPTQSSYPWHGGAITRLIERRGGGLAVGTMANGFYLLSPDGRELVFDHRNSPIQNWTRVVFEDREGNLWLGTGSGGLSVIRETGLAVLSPPDNWQGRTALSVAPGPEQSLWIGTEGAGLYRLQHGQWTRFAEEQGLPNLFVWSLAADPTGRMWAGTWGAGLFRQAGERFVGPEELASMTTPVFALQWFGDASSLWVGTGAGLLHLVHGAIADRVREPGQQDLVVCAVEGDARGVIWLGLPDRGLGRVEGESLTILGRDAGLSSDSVQCLLADGDSLWIGTRDAGLNRLRDGRFAAIDRSRGLISNVICHIADDQRGFIWLSTHHGIMRVAKEELHRCADGAIAAVRGRRFDKTDGLPTPEFSGGLQAAGCRTADGRLWFTSNKGVVSIEPAAIQTNTTPPPVVIESLNVDSRSVAVTPEAAALRLLPAHQRLEFHYTALTLVAASKTQFRHRLVGLDREWIDAGSKRVATYSQLPRGDYRFDVIACNQDEVWNNAGASLAFTVLPFYWQTWWFRTIAAVLVLSAVGWVVRFVTRRRMQARVRELEYERGIERERSRIAQDIHDDIGSSLTRISMLSQSLRTELEQPQRAAAVLERIHRTALDVTTALDEIVWAVSPRHDTLDSFVSYVAKFAQETLAAAGIRCRLDLPVNLPAWPLNTHARHNLMLAFKEALHNTLKHAGASEVRVSLTLRPDEFVVAVEDNGRGFEPALVASAGGTRGNGLGNMRHRLEQLGGGCAIAAEAGRGVRIQFVVHRAKLAAPSQGRRLLPPR